MLVAFAHEHAAAVQRRSRSTCWFTFSGYVKGVDPYDAMCVCIYILVFSYMLRSCEVCMMSIIQR